MSPQRGISLGYPRVFRLINTIRNPKLKNKASADALLVSFATAGWLNRLFASAAWLFFSTASRLAAVLSHHACEKTFDASTACNAVTTSICFATASWLNWLNWLFASAAWLFFSTANWLATVIAAMLRHHACENAFDSSATCCTVASIDNFSTANGLNRLFTSAGRFCFCTTNWLACIASISFTKSE